MVPEKNKITILYVIVLEKNMHLQLRRNQNTLKASSNRLRLAFLKEVKNVIES